jgi:hypothetical protein
MKAQAAMEFLMTYGWAILIVIAVVIALYSMGVFKIPTGGGGKCSPCFPPGSAVAYVDHNADRLVLKVGPNEISTTRVIVGTSSTPSQVGPFAPSTTITYISTGLFAGDQTIIIEYTEDLSGIMHNVTATINGA